MEGKTGFFLLEIVVFYDEILQWNINSTGNQMVFCILTATAMSNQEEQKKIIKKNDDNFQKLYQSKVFLKGLSSLFQIWGKHF